ncbi:single-stranded DNA-binding protein [Ralstonia sp. 1138]|uniref:single-stranded DNA-binding protein n=1 Tax=Ralstonia sp. 1138 TaxID=3156423 RepID=UPI003390CDC7
MPNRIEITGNLGQAPNLKYVETPRGKRQVAEFTIFADEYRRNAADELEQSGGFWCRVTAWEPQAERVAKLLPRGARVHVVGAVRVTKWTDEHDQEQTGIDVSAEKVTLELGRVESVTLKRRAEADAEVAADGPGDPPL